MRLLQNISMENLPACTAVWVRKDFPIGKGGNYRPLTLNYTALNAASTVTAEQFETAITGNLPPYTTLFPNRSMEYITKRGQIILRII
jgi:hypothetical protein